MKCFDLVDPWTGKVNYVDANNVVLGFDTERCCCESFGHAVVSSLAEAKEVSEGRADPSPLDITAYSFAQEPPHSVDCSEDCAEYNHALAFRILAPNMRDLFVAIWNHHNGYYSHGFTLRGPGVAELDGIL